MTRSVPPHCVVTGSASGIGAALVARLLAAGWRVTGIDLVDVTAPASGYRHVQGDLTDAGVLAQVGQAVSGEPVTAFVHSAGIVRTGGVSDTRPEDADRLWRLHVSAPMALMQMLAPCLPDRRGRVVILSSRAVLGRAHRAAYAASKAAQIGWARSIAAELIPRGVTVNVVAPGAVDTPMLIDPKRGAPPQITLPMGRLIDADEVAATIEFLLGPLAGAITGQTLYICGGASLGAAAF